VRLRQQVLQLREELATMDLLRDDNDRLRKENQLLAMLKIDHDEMERLRRQNEELVRLRGKLGVAQRVLADNTRQLEDAQSQVNASLARAATFGETNVITEVEAAAVQHLSIATKTELLRKTLQALIDVAQTNQTGWQLDPNQLTPEGEARLKALESAFDFDVVYRGPLNQLQNPGQTIVIRQRQAEQRTDGTYTRIYGFGDGHVEICKTSDGNFEAWEKERTAPANR
jgi:surface antigen